MYFAFLPICRTICRPISHTYILPIHSQLLPLHDFHETPSSDVLFMLLEQMKHSNADIVKLAMMPQNTEDVLRLLEETNHFHKRYPEQLLITMSMGKMGAISRVCGELFGSCVTFGAGKNASAPGQIQIEKLEEILDVLRLS